MPSYAICRNDRLAYKVFRARSADPVGWSVMETLESWEAAQARRSTLIAARKATVDAANRRVREALGPTAFGRRRLKITEADLDEKGLAGAIGGAIALRFGDIAYLRWVDAGRPSL